MKKTVCRKNRAFFWRFMVLWGLMVLSIPIRAEESQLTILLYHHIDEETPRSTSTTPQEFAAHLDYLKRNGFTVMPLKQGLERLFSGQTLPARAIAITFDDGYRSIYYNAWPLLRQFDFPFTLFVDTQSVDKGYSLMMNWQQLKELSQAGVTIANHSASHPHMLSLSLEQAANEIDQAEQRLMEQLGQSPKLFAYPFGEFNLALTELLRAKGYYGLAQYSGPASPQSPPQAIPRFSFSGNYAGLSQFRLKVNTLAMPVQSIKPANPHHQRPPKELQLTVTQWPFEPHQMSCFFQGEPIRHIEWHQRTAIIRLAQPPSIGRSRVNCTAPSQSADRYYWQSIPMFVEPENGPWPD